MEELSGWEYREFEIRSDVPDRLLFGWLREGWELVGAHLKGTGRLRPFPVLIVRRRLAGLVDTQ